MSRIDETDRTIIGLLQRDGRARVRTIADAVDLPESTTRDRLRSLEERGLIRGYQAQVDLRKLGLDVVGWVFVDVPHSQAAEFSAYAEAQPPVLRGYAVANRPNSFALKVAAKDTHKLSRTVQSWRRKFDVRVQDLLLVDDVTPPDAGLDERDQERLVLSAANERLD